jgi:adenosylcobinamide kinase / adenosylcobinamide-phosphate guanylyltransferase
MLGEQVHDPLGLEGPAGSSDGLGLLAFSTDPGSRESNCAMCAAASGAGRRRRSAGYEIHAGVTRGAALAQPAVYAWMTAAATVHCSADGQILGTYLHGLFETPGRMQRDAALGRIAGCAGSGLPRLARARYRAAWRTWWSSIWIPDCCASYVGFEGMTMLQLILGGARSGKSRLAEKLASDSAMPVTYIATSQPLDGEMNARVALHRQRRPSQWGLIEEPLELARVLRENAAPGHCLLVDCLTLWLTNLLLLDDPQRLGVERESLLDCLASLPGEIIFVSNETGLGVVPLGELTRRYVDEAGWLHQALAERCQRVVLTVAGLPLTLKGTAL